MLRDARADIPIREAKVVAAREVYWALPAAERVAHVFGGVRRLEFGVALAAVFDAVTQARPLEASGLAAHTVLWVQIAATAGAIWFTANVLGWLSGKIALSLRGDRKRLALGAFAVVGVALVGGFVMLGVARHAWTDEQNLALWRAAHDRIGVPTLLDPLWLSCFQIAVAGAAIVGVGMYVTSEAGRDRLERVAEAEAQLAASRESIKELEDELEVLRRVREDADIAIELAAIAGIEAGVEADVAARRWDAERASEDAATKAAVARKDHIYWTEEKSYANGGCWMAQRPDPRLTRRLGNPERVYAQDETGTPPVPWTGVD